MSSSVNLKQIDSDDRITTEYIQMIVLKASVIEIIWDYEFMYPTISYHTLWTATVCNLEYNRSELVCWPPMSAQVISQRRISREGSLPNRNWEQTAYWSGPIESLHFTTWLKCGLGSERWETNFDKHEQSLDTSCLSLTRIAILWPLVGTVSIANLWNFVQVCMSLAQSLQYGKYGIFA